MKKIIFFFFVVTTFSYQVFAQDRGFGVGVIIGEPTGISTKFWTSQSTALQFGLAWGSRRGFMNNPVSVSGDYLWHSYEAIRSSSRFPLYYGVGGVLSSETYNYTTLGVRGVFGISWMSREVPVDVFLQVVPTFALAPSTGIDLGAGAGLRFFFR